LGHSFSPIHLQENQVNGDQYCSKGHEKVIDIDMQALFLRMDIIQHCIRFPFIRPYSHPDRENYEEVHIKELS
jgi:hypothetical protein